MIYTSLFHFIFKRRKKDAPSLHNLHYVFTERKNFFSQSLVYFCRTKKNTLPSRFRSRKAQNDVKPNDAGVVDISGVRRDAGRISTKRMRRNFSAWDRCVLIEACVPSLPDDVSHYTTRTFSYIRVCGDPI